ncbi:MAG: serine hydrolase [Bacteroidales bacterium]|nr:serine hydrolase [Bacteroidales bacterium]
MTTYIIRQIKFNIIFTFVFIILYSYCSAQEKYNNVDFNQLDTYFENAITNWEVPGMAIAIVQDDSVIYSKGFGIRNINSDEKIDEYTLFGIASNTKAFTSAAIAILIDEGKISLDDPVTKYIPYFKLYAPYVTKTMTVRDLLCHRSGLETFSGDLLWYGSSYSREEVIRRAKYLKPKYGFRSHYGYSNIMYLTAGEIIPVVTGISWDDFIEQRFFKPLGMKLSNTSISKLDGIKNIAQPHVKSNDTLVTIPYISWDNIAPAGAINSNAIEMTKWIKLQLNKGTLNDKEYFSEKGSKEMWSPHTIDNFGEWEELIYPSSHFRAYGLGWELFDFHGRKVINHNGGLDGMISQVILVPEENLGFVILTNASSSLPYILMYYILDVFFNTYETDYSELFLGYKKQADLIGIKKKEKEENDRIKNTHPTLNLANYTGTYGGEMYGNAEISIKNNQLHIQFIPTKALNGVLEHWHYDTFKIRWNDYPSLPSGTLQFIIGTNGKVEEMRIEVKNPDFDFTELEFLKAE